MRNWFNKYGWGVFAALIVVAIIRVVANAPAINKFYHPEQTQVSESNILSEPNFTDTVQQTIKSVVHVRCPQWQGSGFIIDKNIICTARHVVEDVEDFVITFNGGKKIHSTRAISDKDHDVGFIWVEQDMNDVAEIGSIKDCKLGQDVFIIGSPYGDINFNSVSKGIISGLSKDWDMIDPWTGERYGWEISFTSDSAAHPGNSGGAVFTMDGKVRGVIVGGFSPVLNCSMPCDLFLPDIEYIRMMFMMDKYQFEEAPEIDWAEEAWGY
jgi:serine protease DegQ